MAQGAEDAVRGALADVVGDHGWDVASNPPRLRAMLSDLLGDQADSARAFVDAIAVSADEGVPGLLAGEVATPELVQGLAARLEQWGLTPMMAAWVVESWAMLAPAPVAQPVTEVGTTPSSHEVPVPIADPTEIPHQVEVAPAEATATPAPSAPPGPELVAAAGTASPTELPGHESVPNVASMATVLPPGLIPGDEDVAEPVPAHRRRVGLVAALAVAGLILAGGAAAVWANRDGEPTAGPSTAPSETTPTDTSTDDPDESTSPAPDPVKPNLATASSVTPPRAPGLTAMAARTGGVRVTALGEVEDIEGERPPAGAYYVGFTLANFPGDLDSSPWRKLPLRVAIGTKNFVVPSGGSTFVATVPEGETAVDLIYRAAGVTQQLSLITGEPGNDNIVVLARGDRNGKLERDELTVNETWAQPLDDGTAGGGTTFARQLKFTAARLSYFGTDVRPSATDRAVLGIVGPPYTVQVGTTTRRGALYEDEVHFRTGGRSLKPERIIGPDEAGVMHYLFEVPADLQSGTLDLGGRHVWANGNASVLASSKVKVTF
ncbi:hypothetical protein NOCA2150151 [metagenome]|uniref:Uncharacterized protein n=1 Tax=metagenome TaxID=256318 RepID=A0A2P2BXD5_9ZZZZ